MKTVLVLVMLVVGVLGKSIDNPAATPDSPGGMEKAVPTVEENTKSREGKSIAVPPPVQVTSGVVTVLGDARKGRVIEIGDDGIPIIHGVRVPDDPNDTKIYRNARIVNNKLITAEDEIKMNGIQGRSLSSQTEGDATPSQGRKPRILINGAPSSTKGSQSSSMDTANGAQQFPEFFYRKYMNNERVGVIAESSFEDDNISTASEKVVSYSYLAAPQGGSRSDTSKSTTSVTSGNNVVYGTGSAAKPPGQGASDGPVVFEQVKASSIVVPQQQQVVFQPSSSAGSNSVDVSSSISNAVPFGHNPNPIQTFAVHQEPTHAHGHTQFHPQPATAPPRAPPTVFQTNPNNFVIQDTTFQAHPGAPTFSLPIPVPTKQALKPRRRQPYHQHQILASSEVVEHAVPATGELSYTNFNQYDVPSTRKPIYKTMMEPFMKAGEKIYEMASPVFDPMINAGQKLTQRFRVPSRASAAGSSNSLSFANMNDYISRTVDENNLPIVAGVAALAAITLGIAAVAASSNITIGKRSVDDPAEEFMYQMLDLYPTEESTLLNRLEEYTSWTDSKCSKRVFCDVMTRVGDDYLYTIEKRLDMFLRVLNHGSAEESNLKRTANDVMKAVRRNECDIFNCFGTDVDSSRVAKPSLSRGPR